MGGLDWVRFRCRPIWVTKYLQTLFWPAAFRPKGAQQRSWPSAIHLVRHWEITSAYPWTSPGKNGSTDYPALRLSLRLPVLQAQV